MARTYMTFKRR